MSFPESSPFVTALPVNQTFPASEPMRRSPLATVTGQRSSSLLFIDENVDDVQGLVRGAAAGTEVHVLRSGLDAIAQITNVLLGRSGIESLQIVSHGKSGGLKLGEDWLDVQSLPSYVGQLKTWGNALSENADILLYGCDVAQDATGKDFIELLAQTTGADVAASDDVTGNAALGGDWDLEFRTGTIEAALALTPKAINEYQSSLGDVFRNYGNVSRLTRVAGSSPLTQINVGQDTDVHTISVANDLQPATGGNLKFLIFGLNGSTGTLLYESEAKFFGDDGNAMSEKKSDPIAFKLEANKTYLIGAISDVAAAWGYDEVANSNQTSKISSTLTTFAVSGFTNPSLSSIAGNNRDSALLIRTNDAPILTVAPSSLTYTENQAPQVLDNTASIADVDSPNFANGKLTVKFSTGATDADRLAIRNEGTGANQINFSGANVFYGETQIGNFTGGIGTTDLVINLNADANVTNTQALLRNITFANVSDAPSTTDRQITFTLYDGDAGTSIDPNAGTSVAVSKTVKVTAVNDRPTGAPTATLPKGKINTAYSISTADLLKGFSDPDGDSLSVVDLTVTNGTFTSSVGGYLFQPTNNFTGKVTLTYKVSDGNGGIFAGQTRELMIDPLTQNVAPTRISLVNMITNLAANTDTTSRFRVANIVVTDPDGGNNNLTVIGADRQYFVIEGNQLYLRPGTVLSQSTYNVGVSVIDPTSATPTVAKEISMKITIGNASNQPTPVVTQPSTIPSRWPVLTGLLPIGSIGLRGNSTTVVPSTRSVRSIQSVPSTQSTTNPLTLFRSIQNRLSNWI